MCEEWDNSFVEFENWALSNGYNPELKGSECTIDRIDNDKGYYPDNCRWVDQKTQCNNKSNCNYITYNEETHTLSEWSRIVGVNSRTLRDRIYKLGWPIEEALFIPAGNYHGIQRLKAKEKEHGTSA